MVARGTLALFVALWLLGAGWQPPPSPLDRLVDTATRGQRFDLVLWEVHALRSKLYDAAQPPDRGLDEAASEQVVRDYLRLGEEAGRLSDEIERLYADPAVKNPDAASAARRTQLAADRSLLSAQARQVEAVLEQQMTAVLDTAGMTSAGMVWPPVRFSFSDPPQMLVISPRDRIERLRSVDLLADLDSAQRTALEDQVERDGDLSAYVTGIGGYGVYPTMVIDRYGLAWTAETVAHEWVHNYLAFRPLGWAYLDGGDAVTINETVASIAGEELGRALLAQHYPDLLPAPAPASPPAPSSPAEPPAFEFGAEMHSTRLVVDALLADGYVAEAEAFMAARRLTFSENGYALRVLNQAYFAFHGSYATGAAATDPIGPKLQRLRSLSPSLAAFLRTAASLHNAAELDQALAAMEAVR